MLWFFTGLAGRLYNFDSFVYYYGIKFILNGNSWTKEKVELVYASGPVFVFITSLLSLYLYSTLKNIRSMVNLFFLWYFIIGISVSMAQIIIATLGIYNYYSLYYQGLAVTFAWMRMPYWLVYTLMALAFLFIIYVGVNCARMFLFFSYSYSKVNNLKRRRKYFSETVVVPFAVGALITIITVFPKDISAKNILILLASTHLLYLGVIAAILSIGWLSLAYLELSKPELGRYKSLQLPSVLTIVFTVISWILIYVIFWGIYIKR